MRAPETVTLFGDDALSVSVTSKARRNALAKALQISGAWREVVPGAMGLSVQYDPATLTPREAQAQLQQALAAAIIPDTQSRKAQVIPVCYAPAYALDMAHICTLTSLSEAEIIARHTGARHHVDMIGFTPGFAYLEGGDRRLDVPRLATPRAHVPAGSIGLAGGLTGLYALPGPGGWPIIGRTPMPLFDTSRADPFTLEPGQMIQFEAISQAAFEAWT